MIPPGGEGQIKVTLKPKGHHVQIKKDITVLSNDPDQPRFKLTMKGTLLVDMIADPVSVSFQGLPPGEKGELRFNLRRTEDSTADVTSVKLEDTENFSLRKVTTAPEAVATYEVRFKGSKDIGVTATNVVVQTTGDNTPELTLPVRANVAYNLRYPKRFGFSWREGKLMERTIRITTRRGDAPKIKKVVDPEGLLDIEVLPPQGPMVSLRLRVREDAIDKAQEGMHTLLVHTNDKDEPKLELEYSVMAPGSARRALNSASQARNATSPPRRTPSSAPGTVKAPDTATAPGTAH